MAEEPNTSFWSSGQPTRPQSCKTQRGVSSRADSIQQTRGLLAGMSGGGPRPPSEAGHWRGTNDSDPTRAIRAQKPRARRASKRGTRELREARASWKRFLETLSGNVPLIVVWALLSCLASGENAPTGGLHAMAWRLNGVSWLSARSSPFLHWLVSCWLNSRVPGGQGL